jgi:hypothetical protein
VLVDALLGERRRAVLLGRALEGAARSIAEEKIDWFARCLAAGYLATDDAVVDKELFFVDALAQVEVPHIQVLTFLAKAKDDRERLRPPTTDELSDAFMNLCPVIRPVLAALERVGLAVKQVAPAQDRSSEQRETGVPHVWQVSTFGGYLPGAHRRPI